MLDVYARLQPEAGDRGVLERARTSCAEATRRRARNTVRRALHSHAQEETYLRVAPALRLCSASGAAGRGADARLVHRAIPRQHELLENVRPGDRARTYSCGRPATLSAPRLYSAAPRASSKARASSCARRSTTSEPNRSFRARVVVAARELLDGSPAKITRPVSLASISRG